MVIILDVIEHLIDPERILREIKSVLKPSGKLILTIPNDYTLANIIRMVLFNKPIKWECDLWNPRGHIQFPTINNSNDLLSKYFIIKKLHFGADSFTVPLLPNKIKDFLARFFPSLFCPTVFYYCLNKK
jgi:SAM-dependent methyltransferase